MKYRNKQVKHDEVRNGIRTLIFVALATTLQFIWTVSLYVRLYEISTTLTLLLSIFALVVALAINGEHTNTAENRIC